MATLANIVNIFIGAGTVAESTTRTATRVSDLCALRAVPNEDVYFFTKRIDNSRVIRQADARARAREVRLVAGAGVVAVSFIAMLLPSAYGLMAGYQLTSLQQTQQLLITERARLELEEARLMSPERLQALAREQEFVDPSPDRTVYLTPSQSQSLALNRQ